MLLYLSFIIIYYIVGLFELIKKTSLNQRKTMCFLLMLPLWFLAAFRDVSIGTDTLTYYRGYVSLSFFNSLGDVMSSNFRMERGYITVAFLCSKAGLSFLQFQVVIYTFIFYSFYKFFSKNALNIGLVCLILLTAKFGGIVTTTRMHIAIAILVHTLPLIYNKKLIPFLLVVGVAMLFHKSAAVFALVYPLMYIKNSKLRTGIIIMFCWVN